MKKETTERLLSRTTKIIALLHKEYPNPKIALNFSNPLELLIAVILSAQCTDVRVNIVTATLFQKYKSAKDYAFADSKELEADIHSTGFYKNKAKNIIACCTTFVETYGGKVPSTMEELTELAGVGRKTANCVLGGAYGMNVGVVVDTHVKRLSNRLGLTNEQAPVKIEEDLATLLPQKEWFNFGNLLIWHGRRVCDARKPKCSVCVLNQLCPLAEI